MRVLPLKQMLLLLSQEKFIQMRALLSQQRRTDEKNEEEERDIKQTQVKEVKGNLGFWKELRKDGGIFGLSSCSKALSSYSCHF